MCKWTNFDKFRQFISKSSELHSEELPRNSHQVSEESDEVELFKRLFVPRQQDCIRHTKFYLNPCHRKNKLIFDLYKL